MALKSVSVGKKSDHLDLPGMTLGMMLRVQITGIGSFQSRLLGMEQGKFVLIQPPSFVDICTKRNEKNHFVISYLYLGRVYGFRCTLLQLVREPYRFAILSYPEVLDNINLRKHERISCLIRAEVRVKEQSYEGVVSDISRGGCSFEFNNLEQRGFPSLRVQEEMIVSMQFIEDEEMAVFNTIIRTIQTDKESMVCGLQFHSSGFAEADADAEKQLADFLATLQTV